MTKSRLSQSIDAAANGAFTVVSMRKGSFGYTPIWLWRDSFFSEQKQPCGVKIRKVA
jgi:hypothetical protein